MGPWVDPSWHLYHLGPAGACEGTGPVDRFLQDLQDTESPRRAPVNPNNMFQESLKSYGANESNNSKCFPNGKHQGFTAE